MGTGQTMLTLGAFVLLMTILVTFYRLLAQSGETIDNAQAGITCITLATSIEEIAHGLAFDEVTIDSFFTSAEIGNLTDPIYLGRENPPPAGEPYEDSSDIQSFDDFDDFNGITLIDSTQGGTLGKYKAYFVVRYVDPYDIDKIKNNRQFTKRMVIKIWRYYPPSTDTLTIALVSGYFHFN